MTRELRQLCEQVRQLAEKIRKDLMRQAADTPAKIVALYMFAKGYKSYQAALLLYRKGFWQDAASVARTLLELSFQAGWLDKSPDKAAKLFLQGEERDRIKLLKNLAVSGDEETKRQADALLKTLSTSADIDLSWRKWWGRNSNIKRLANKVGFAQLYGLQYGPLSEFIHSSPITIQYFLSDEEKPVPDCKPSVPPRRHPEFAEICLSAAPRALMGVLAVVDNVFKLNRQKEFDRVAATLQKYEESEAGREETKGRR